MRDNKIRADNIIGVKANWYIETQKRRVVDVNSFGPEECGYVHHLNEVLADRGGGVDVGGVVDKVESDGTVLVGLKSSALICVIDCDKLLVFDHFVVDASWVAVEDGDDCEEDEICYHFIYYIPAQKQITLDSLNARLWHVFKNGAHYSHSYV